jgi:hypothetical protein
MDIKGVIMNPGLVFVPVTALAAYAFLINQASRNSSLAPESSQEPPSERLSRIFGELVQNEAFASQWNDVNERLHKPINLIPSPPEGDKNYQKFAAIKATRCLGTSSSCQNTADKIAHGFNMYVNVEPRTPDTEVKFSIIFEMYNVMHWYDHLQITAEAKQFPQEASSEELAVRREDVEWTVLQETKNLAQMIDSKICDEKQYPWKDFKSYLATQKKTGHFDRAKQEIEKLRV